MLAPLLSLSLSLTQPSPRYYQFCLDDNRNQLWLCCGSGDEKVLALRRCPPLTKQNNSSDKSLRAQITGTAREDQLGQKTEINFY